MFTTNRTRDRSQLHRVLTSGEYYGLLVMALALSIGLGVGIRNPSPLMDIEAFFLCMVLMGIALTCIGASGRPRYYLDTRQIADQGQPFNG